MSSIRKGGSRGKGVGGGGGGRKPSQSKPKPTQTSSKPNAGKQSAPSSSTGSHTCFACGQSFTSTDELIAHYEDVFSRNEEVVHSKALVREFGPEFDAPTSCQLCGQPFSAGPGSLLAHVFSIATASPPTRRGGMSGAEARHNQEMHASLFQSFVQELIDLGTGEATKEEAVEYIRSLLLPDYESDDDDSEESDNDDDELNDLYEDEDDLDSDNEEIDPDEFAEFAAFLAAQGLDSDDIDGLGLGGHSARSRKGKKKKSEPEFGGPRQKMEFMKQFMKMSMGIDGFDESDEDDDDDEDEESFFPKSRRGARTKRTKSTRSSAAASSSTASTSTAAAAASAASSAPPAVPLGTNLPGDLKCSCCSQLRSKESYSATQLKSKGKRKCRYCVDAAATSNATGGGSRRGSNASAHDAPTVTSTPNLPPAAASTTSPSSSTSTSSPSSSTSAAVAPASSPTSTNRTEEAVNVVSEPEDWDGNSEDEGGGGGGSDEDDETNEHEDEEDSEEDEEDGEEYDSDEDEDPLAALFGAARRRAHRKFNHRSHRGRGRSTRARATPTARSMHMRILPETPGQALTRDRRLRLRPSESAPIRCWVPRHSQGHVPICTHCSTRISSRLHMGWQLSCMKCALQHGWVSREERLNRSDDDDEEDDDGEGVGWSSRTARMRRRQCDSKFVAHFSSRFPVFRAGVPCCPREVCGSDAMMVVYDEHADEWIVCATCRASKQKLRYYDSMSHRLVESLQEPITRD